MVRVLRRANADFDLLGPASQINQESLDICDCNLEFGQNFADLLPLLYEIIKSRGQVFCPAQAAKKFGIKTKVSQCHRTGNDCPGIDQIAHDRAAGISDVIANADLEFIKRLRGLKYQVRTVNFKDG